MEYWTEMSTANPKSALFQQFAVVGKAVGHASRLELLEHLAQGERTVETLAARTGLSVTSTSQHLQLLRRAGLVAPRRAGRFVHYRLADDAAVDLLTSLRRVAEKRSAEVEQVVRSYFHDRDSLEPVSRTDLLERLRAGAITLIDVRPADEFALGHLPGALHIPLADLERRVSELDPGRPVVAYCRGPYCVLAYEAVALLRHRGFDARRLEAGLPEWRAAGLPIEGHRTPPAG